MLQSGTDPESYITEYTLVYEDKIVSDRGDRCVSPELAVLLLAVEEGGGELLGGRELALRQPLVQVPASIQSW